MTKLSRDTWRIVVKDLDVEDIISLRLVCKEYAKMLGPEHTRLWEMLCKRDHPPNYKNIKNYTKKSELYLTSPFWYYAKKYMRKVAIIQVGIIREQKLEQIKQERELLRQKRERTRRLERKQWSMQRGRIDPPIVRPDIKRITKKDRRKILEKEKLRRKQLNKRK